MKSKIIDPTYVNRVDLNPSYRVDFWTGGNASEEWKLTEVRDINEVLVWAKEHSLGRIFVVYAEFDHATGHGMIRLFGEEPPGY